MGDDQRVEMFLSDIECFWFVHPEPRFSWRLGVLAVDLRLFRRPQKLTQKGLVSGPQAFWVQQETKGWKKPEPAWE
jgi:hypothetical protein